MVETQKDYKDELSKAIEECCKADGFLVFCVALDKETGRLNSRYIKHEFYTADIPKVIKIFREHAYRDMEGRV